MADYPDELKEIMQHLDTTVSRMLGAQEQRQQNQKSRWQQFSKGVDNASQGLKMLHGSAAEASYTLHRFLGGGLIATAVMALVGNLTTATQTFSKMTDVGQTFGGSIFEMQRLAGEFGLSLQEFADQVKKSSTIIAQMSDNQSTGVSMFSKYQKNVRTSLEQFGMFGMTVSQLNEASSDYAETLRQTGRWQRMGDQQRETVTQDFIRQVSAMAAASGKSREEIMKMVNQAARSPSAAAVERNLNEQQQAMLTGIRTTFAGAPAAASESLNNFMTEMLEHGGRIWETKLGGAFMNMGRGEALQPLQDLFDRMLRGEKFDPELAFKRIQQFGEAARAVTPGLTDYGEANADLVNAISGVGNALNGFSADVAARRYKDTEQAKFDPVTQAMATFENNFNAITGDFRQSFYKGIIDMLPGQGPKEKLESFQNTLTQTKEILGRFAEVLGGIVGWFVERLPAAEKAFETFVAAVSYVNRKLESAFSLIPGLHDEKGKASPMAKLLAVVSTLAIAIGGFKFLKAWLLGGLKRMVNIEARVAIINARSLGGKAAEMMQRREQAYQGKERQSTSTKTSDAAIRERRFSERRADRDFFTGQRQARPRADWTMERRPPRERLTRNERVQRVEQYKQERAERLNRTVARPKPPAGGVMSRLLSSAPKDLARGGLRAMGASMLMRGVVGGLILGTVEVLADQAIDAIPMGEKAKEMGKDALSGALTGGAIGFMAGGPLGAVVGAMIGGLAGYLKDALPTPEEARKQVLDRVAPQMNKDLAAQKTKLHETNTQLDALEESYKASKDQPDADPEALKKMNEEIIRLQRQQIDQSDCLIALQRQANEIAKKENHIPGVY